MAIFNLLFLAEENDTFGDLKDNYNLDNIRVAKMARVKVFMDLSCIALLASRLSDAVGKDKTKSA